MEMQELDALAEALSSVVQLEDVQLGDLDAGEERGSGRFPAAGRSVWAPS